MTDLQKTIKVLLNADLTSMNKTDVKNKFRNAYAFALKHEKYRLAAKLKTSEDRYKESLKKM